MIRPTLWQRTHVRLRSLFTPSPAAERLIHKLDLYELEERIFLSATPIAPELLGAALDADESVEVHDDAAAVVANEPISPHDLEAAPNPDSADHLADDVTLDPHSDGTLVIVDTSVTGHEELVNSLLEQQTHDDTLHLLLLDAGEDGVDQITRGLEQYDDLAAIHFLSHGTDGNLRLGGTWLDADHVSGYAGQIAGWGEALAEGGDLLFYGCDLAASEEGRTLLEAIHELTGKDVAASIDTTGHASLGGDWTLEFTLGQVTTPELLSTHVQSSWLHVMSSETIQDNFADFHYSGSDGTKPWSGDWSEIGESDGAGDGYVQVASHDLGGDGTHSLRIFAHDGVGIERAVNLETASSATLTFSWLRSELGVGFNSLDAEISGDGGNSWTTLESINLRIDLTPNSSTFDITNYISGDTHIRFVVSGSGLGSVYLDEVHINYETAAAPEPLPPTNSAPVLNAGDPLSLSDIAEDDLLSVGTLVSEILTSAGGDRITDADSSALEGIAVIGVDNTYGQWQYDATGSGDWQTFGSVANDNAVLLAADSRVRFVPQTDFNGDAGQITFRAWDQTSGSVGQTGVNVTDNGGETAFSTATDSASLVVTAVNDAPVWTLPADFTVDEDTRLNITGLSIADVDANTGELLVSLSVDHGALSLGDMTGLTFSAGDGTDDATLTFTGTLSDINAALATLSFQGGLNENGPAALSASVSDQANTGSGGALADSGSVNIDVTAVNDAPVWTLPADLMVDEDTRLNITGLSIADVDANTGELLVSLSVDHGALSLGGTTGLTFSAGDGADDATLTFTGTLSDINAALATLSFQGGLNENGPVALSASVSDQANTGSGGALADSGSVNIDVAAVNDAPTTTGLLDVVVNEDAPVTRVRLYDAFSDVENADNALQYQLIDVTDPGLFSDVVIVDATGQLLLRYAPNMHGESDITVRVTDREGLYVDDTLHVTVNSVNDAPEATANNYALRGDETLIVAAPGLLQNDSDVDGDRLRAVLVRGPQHGLLILNRDGSFRYEPDPSYVGIDSFVYAASDGQAASELTPVFIKVSAPTSPVDSGSTTPIPKDNPNSPLSDLFLDVSTNLVSLLNQESPHAVTPSVATSPFALRANMTREDGHTLVVIDPAASLGQLSLANLSDDLAANRWTNRTRSAEDAMESLVASVESVPTSVASEFVTPVVTLSSDELSDVSAELGESDYLHRWMVGSAVGLTTGLTVGYVLWTVRAGYLLTGLIAQVPAWRFVDPLPILNSLDGARGAGDGESLASIVQSTPSDTALSA